MTITSTTNQFGQTTDLFNRRIHLSLGDFVSRGGRRFVKFHENFSPSNPRELAGITSPPGLCPDCLTYVIEVAFHDCDLRQAWNSGKRSVWTTRLEVKPRPEISQSYRCLYDTHFLATKILFRRLLPKLRAVKAVAVINTQAVRGIGCNAKQIRRLRLLSRQKSQSCRTKTYEKYTNRFAFFEARVRDLWIFGVGGNESH